MNMSICKYMFEFGYYVQKFVEKPKNSQNAVQIEPDCCQNFDFFSNHLEKIEKIP